VKKLGSVVVLVILVSAIAWSQTIPQVLQGSWGANGSQAIRINADGSGEWGEGNLSQSATFRVTGNTLRVQAMNMEGQIQWRVDENSLFLTNPAGFLGELLIAVMKNGGIDRLTRMGTSVASVGKPITVTLNNIPQRFIGRFVGMIFVNNGQQVAQDLDSRFGSHTLEQRSHSFQMLDLSISSATDIEGFYLYSPDIYTVAFIIFDSVTQRTSEAWVTRINIRAGDNIVDFSSLSRN